ncbi:MAG TPA: extracellular solute-binding protein, partial [Arachnia sp.]|nr:extracellular solute-binding protein [Arachnia sp.]
MTTRIVKNSARAVAAVAAVSLALTACGSDATPESTSGGTTTGAPAATGSVYYLNFKPEQAEQWVELAGKYTKETGVEVTVETAASGTYAATLKSEMAKSDPPSIFQVNGPVGLATWQDYTADLTDTALYKNLNVAEMALKSADGSQVSAVPYVIETYGLIYNKALLAKYFALPDAAIKSIDDLNNFAALKAVAEGIQANKDALGVDGAFTSSGFDPSSDWRFKTHLANMPLY